MLNCRNACFSHCNAFIATVAILFSHCGIVEAATAKSAKHQKLSPEQKYEEFLTTKKYSKALDTAAEIARGKEPAEKKRGLALTARVYREQDQLDKAAAKLEDYFFIPTVLDADGSAACYMEVARIHMARRDFARALSTLDFLGKNQTGLPRSEAAEAMGDIFLETSALKDAISLYEMALKFLPVPSASEIPNPACEALKARVQPKLADARARLTVETYGNDFLLFREAETHRRKEQNFAKALTGYETVIRRYPDSMFAEAARFYRCECLVRCGRTAAALTALDSFVRANPYGLYRGEALVEKGRILLEENLDVPGATAAFRAAQDWCDEVAHHDALAANLTMKPAAEAASRPPPTEYRRNDFGFLFEEEIQPGQLFNHKNSPRYMSWLRKQVILGLGFDCVLNKKAEEGKALFAKLPELDQDEAEKAPYDAPGIRTRLTASAESGLCGHWPEEMKGLSGKMRTACLLGEYYYSALLRDRTLYVLNKLLAGGYGSKPSKEATAFAVGVIGDTYYIRGDYATAEKWLSRFEKELRKNPCGPRGLFCWGQTLIQIYGSKEKSKRDETLFSKAIKAYSMATVDAPFNYYGAYAAFAKAFYATYFKPLESEGKKMLKQVYTRYSASPNNYVRQFAGFAQLHMDKPVLEN